MGNFLVRYASRVVIYDCRAVIRLTTGLVVMGDVSCTRGREFESWHRILNGHFSHILMQRLFEKAENKLNKRPRLAHLKNNYAIGLRPLGRFFLNNFILHFRDFQQL